MAVEVFERMLGRTFASVRREENGPTGRETDALVFRTAEGEWFEFSHAQDCCESVGIEDICGELSDLEGSPMLVAECVDSGGEELSWGHQSWSFYRYATAKGAVTVRWIGESNGWYSESVDYYDSLPKGGK